MNADIVSLSEEQSLLKESSAKFVRNEIIPLAAELDEKSEFP